MSQYAKSAMGWVSFKMTHDELWQKICDIHDEGCDKGKSTNKQHESMLKFENALCTVVELHKPLEGTDTCHQFCATNDDSKCMTIVAIESVLTGLVKF